MQISKKVWTIPVQARITLCHPKGQQPHSQSPTASGKIGWPLGVAPSENAGNGQQPHDNFEDMKKMMWMKKGWAQVPVGKDKPEASSSPTPMEECP